MNTIGKSDSFVFNWIAKFVLKRSRVYVRERKSYRELTSWGIPAQLGVDVVFSLENPTPKQNPQAPYLVFVPTDLYANFRHMKNRSINKLIPEKVIKEMSVFCAENSLRVKILPHLTDYKGNNFELDFLLSLKNMFIDNGIDDVEIESISSVFDYEDIIASASLTVSMRYHGVIFAIKQACPFVSLAYESKMREACLYAGMADSCLDIEQIDSFDLGRVLRAVHAKRDELVASLSKRSRLLKRLSLLYTTEIIKKRISYC